MFTGIIRDLGRVARIEKCGENEKNAENGLLLHISTRLPAMHFERGASIAVDGVCLTVEEFEGVADGSEGTNLGGIFQVTAVAETLDKSRISDYVEGSEVNLEPPLTLQDAVAGHLVLGHVDCVAEIVAEAPDLQLKVPAELGRLLPRKGSVTVNGVSLTIAELLDSASEKCTVIRIAIIPETMRATNLGDAKSGDLVNIEIDMVARYLDQLNSSSNS